MKKKAALIAIVVIVCSVLGVVAGSFQKKMLSGQAAGKTKSFVTSSASTESKNDDSAPADKSQPVSSSTQSNAVQTDKSGSSNSNDSKSAASSSNSGKSTASSKPAPAKTSGAPKTTAPVNNKSDSGQKPNNQTSSAPNNFYIINDITGDTKSSREDLAGKKAEDVTKNYLNKHGISSSIDPMSGYVSMIGGLRERQNGPLSGWCYYVNGQKPSVSASEYTLKADDKLVWKYLKDGINNN